MNSIWTRRCAALACLTVVITTGCLASGCASHSNSAVGADFKGIPTAAQVDHSRMAAIQQAGQASNKGAASRAHGPLQAPGTPASPKP